MLQAMYNGVSAIDANQQWMDTIGNNIANVNTTAFKAGQVTFADQLSQTLQGASSGNGSTLGGTDPLQLGLGVQVASIDDVMTQGSLASAPNPTDLAIQGNGMFMVSDPSGVQYTRDGSFSLDSAGNLVNSAGDYVLGWQANSSGAINTSDQVTASSKLSIPVGTLTLSNPTANVSFNGNLNSAATSGTSYTQTVQVYDSLGAPHTVDLTLTQASTATTPNTWDWSVTPDASDTSLSVPKGAVNGGTITFNSNGTYESMTSSNPSTDSSIALGVSGGANALAITPNFSALSQNSATSAVSVASQDGTAPGTLESFSINQTGQITGSFSNGLTQNLGQIALANFSNPQGLQSVGGNNYVQALNSGNPQVAAANSAGMGTVSAGYLEQSNVDLSNEFTNMIISQRGFEANTKIVSTVDQMLSDVINMRG